MSACQASEPLQVVARAHRVKESKVNLNYNVLIDRIREQRVLLFCGPNVSASSTELPSWSVLVRDLVGKFNLPEEFETPLLSVAAQLYVHPESRNQTRNDERRNRRDKDDDKEQEKSRRRSLTRKIASYLDDPSVTPSDVHRYIAALPFNRIVTANWDNLLETAFNQLHKPYATVVHDPDIAYTREGTTALIKLCGSVEQPESLRITLDDLRKLPEEKPEVFAFLAHSARIKTLLFLGFDFSSYEFKQLYDTLLGATVNSKREVVAVQSAPVDDMDYWHRRDVEFINDKMIVFLRTVAEALDISLPTADEDISSCARAGDIVNTNVSGFTMQRACEEEEDDSDTHIDIEIEIRQLLQRLTRLFEKKKVAGSLSVENQIRQVKTAIERLRRKAFAPDKY